MVMQKEQLRTKNEGELLIMNDKSHLPGCSGIVWVELLSKQ